MIVEKIIKILLYSILILFGLFFIIVGIANIKNGLQSSILAIISGLVFSLLNLRRLVFYVMILRNKDEDEE